MMRILIILALFPAAIPAWSAADRPQGYAELLRHYARHPAALPSPPAEREGKCGLSSAFALLDQWPRFTSEERRSLASAVAIPLTQRERVIGHFHFYYDTTGADAPALLDALFNPRPGTAEEFVDSAGAIFNQVWSTEIDQFAYLPPPLQGDNTYPIVIRDFGAGFYGQTVPDPAPISNGPPPRYATHIEIDNDFQYVYAPSRGLPGLRVTAAHEFHHAIQIGSYGYWSLSDRYFYEITSTWMEDEVFPDVNDYLQYLSNDPAAMSQFSHPEVGFTKSNQSIEYSRAVYGKYLSRRFSRDIMRVVWVAISGQRTVAALDAVLQANGSSFRQALQEYAYWNINTGPLSDATRFYPEGHLYPTMRVDTATYFPPQIQVSNQLPAYGTWYTKFCIHRSASDTSACWTTSNSMTAIITNMNLGTAYLDFQYAYTYALAESPVAGARRLSNGIYAVLSVPDPENWSVSETVPSVVGALTLFPNPYGYAPGHSLWFRFPSTPPVASGDLRIFTSSFDLIYDGNLPVLDYRPLEPAIRWDGLMKNGRRIGTGIYFYDLSIGTEHYTGKFAVQLQ